MKKINFAKIIWISSIFLILIIILVAVIVYKIHFQYKIKNQLYFYDCNGTLCVTEVENEAHLLYSKYDCGYDQCPVFRSELSDTYVILDNEYNDILFNYRINKIISSNYEDYYLLNNNYIIVTKDKKQGIINLENQLTVPLEYEQLGYIQDNYLIGYSLNYIIAKKNNKFGIISIEDNMIIEDFIYQESDMTKLLQMVKDKSQTLY